MMKKTVLIIDDDRTERRLLSRVLTTQLNFAHIEAENGQEGLAVLRNHSHIKLIIMDLDMPVMDGRETLKHLTRDYPSIPVIVLTGSKHMVDAVEAMKNGAFDFLSKPLEQERLVVSARNALRLCVMSQEISRLKRQTDGAFTFSDLIGHDGGLSLSVGIGLKASVNALPVLITGETGTGKEMFAQAIHGESERAGQHFIAVNCGALPEKLVESTLFGHEKGAFTGAINKSLGKFREANGGTIFLDEVGELPMDAQVKLLRVLQQQEVEPVGAGQAVKVNARVISATNRDLAQEVREGRFREDLYFRLNVLHIGLPALRDRRADIPRIVEHFIELFCTTHNMQEKPVSPQAMEKAQAYHWPGNVRELENTINRALALSDHEVIQSDDLVFASDQSDREKTLGGDATNVIHAVSQDGAFKSFKDLEAEIIQHALEYHDYNMSKTARVLGIAKSTLYAKLPASTVDTYEVKVS